jgi:hypothetical protein
LRRHSLLLQPGPAAACITRRPRSLGAGTWVRQYPPTRITGCLFGRLCEALCVLDYSASRRGDCTRSPRAAISDRNADVPGSGYPSGDLPSERSAAPPSETDASQRAQTDAGGPNRLGRAAEQGVTATGPRRGFPGLRTACDSTRRLGICSGLLIHSLFTSARDGSGRSGRSCGNSQESNQACPVKAAPLADTSRMR